MKKFFLIIILFNLCLFPMGVLAESESCVSGEECIRDEENGTHLIEGAVSGLLMEESTGKIIFEKEKDKQVAIASMTKMVAQIIILEHIESGKIKWDDIVTVSKNAANMGGSQIYLSQNEKMSVKDLFKGISMASANDVAVTKKQSQVPYYRRRKNKI